MEKIYNILETDKEITEPINLKIRKIYINSDFQVSKDKNCIHIDASKLRFPILLRHWHEGDTFFPFGMNNHKKISDFFIDKKLTMMEKEESWLLVSGDDIVWIVGQRLDNRFRVTDKTTEVIQLTIVN